MEFGWPGVGDDGAYSGVGIAEISWIFAMQGAYFFGMVAFDTFVFTIPRFVVWSLFHLSDTLINRVSLFITSFKTCWPDEE